MSQTAWWGAVLESVQQMGQVEANRSAPPLHLNRYAVDTPATTVLFPRRSRLWDRHQGLWNQAFFCCIRIYSTSPDMHSGLTI